MDEKKFADPRSNLSHDQPPSYPGTQYPSTPPGVYTPQSGVSNQDYGLQTVVYQQPQANTTLMVTPIKDNMGLAIFVTLCCFWPLGLVAILRATEVKTALATNDYARAQRLAKESRRLSYYGIIVGVILMVILVAVSVGVEIATLPSRQY